MTTCYISVFIKSHCGYGFPALGKTYVGVLLFTNTSSNSLDYDPKRILHVTGDVDHFVIDQFTHFKMKNCDIFLFCTKHEWGCSL